MSRLAQEYQAGRVVLGRYRVVLPLAKGGQGIVYLARGEGAAGFARPVVIKRVLTPIAKDPEANLRFVNEARVTSQLRHPDIVSILEFEQESDDTYVMVLEYVHGYDLARWSRFLRGEKRSFDPKLAAYITVRVLEALHYSHTLRAPNGEPTPIVHRDVSPGNVLIDEQGHVKLTDFGIAHTKVQRGDESSSTGKFALQGKLAYLSPELYRGAPPSPQSDLYAAALVLHQLLIGKNEFQARDLASAALRVTTHVPTPVCDVRDDVSKEASDVIAAALAKEPADRPKSARELSLLLRRAFDLDLGEIPERLTQAVMRDFHDPGFAKLADVMPLSEIDHAWREAPQAGPLGSPEASGADARQLGSRQTSSMPTVADGPVTTDQPSQKTQDRGSWFLMSAAALAVAGAAAFVALRLRTSEDRVVFVDKQRAQASSSQPAAPETPPAPAPTMAPIAVKPQPEPSAATDKVEPARPEDPMRKLTRAFGARRREIEACFTDHSAGLSGAPRLHVDFEVSAEGRVTEAHLDPIAIEGTDLGGCLLKVARTTRFGAQPSILRFRIPLTARSQ